MMIKDLKKGDPFLGFLFIKTQLVKTASNGSRYFNMSFSDEAFDTIEAKMWNVSEADEEEFTGGQVVKVKGTVQEYNGHLQLIVNRMRLANEGDSVDQNAFVQCAPIKIEKMLNEVYAVIDAFGNRSMADLVRRIVKKKEKQLVYVPAAKSFHHAIKGGLLFHTWSMLNLGKAVAPQYPFLNTDLLYAGIILHDMGKTIEMLSDHNGVVVDYSPEGKLLGHIVSEIAEIDAEGAALGTDPEVILTLKHMILSHHYEAEFGSPVKPMFPEAELLHHLDIIDARMNTMERIEKELQPGEFSEKIWGLDGIQVYKPALDK